MGLILIILVAGLAVWLMTQSQTSGRCHVAKNTADTDTPIEILRRRYASGEIDRVEYESRKRDLI